MEHPSRAVKVISNTLDGMLTWLLDERLTMLAVNMCLGAYEDD
jgi:hypothetical protein